MGRTLWINLVFACWAALAQGATRGISVQLKASEAEGAPVAQTVSLYAKSFAVIIGNDAYTGGWPRLSMAVKDAEEIAAELSKRGFEVTLKTNLNSDEMEDTFKEFYALKGEDAEARLFVWYAGHGHTLKGEGFLVPTDAPRPERTGQFKLKSLSMRRFGEFVRLAASKHAYAVFDSCFAGTVFNSQRALPPVAITRATTLPVRQFLTSGDAEQTVSDDGRFRKLFLRAIRGEERSDANGDGYVTASELGMFLGDRLTNLTQSRQTPRSGKLRDENYDRGDFVFLASTNPQEMAVKTGPAASPGGDTSAEVAFWQSMEDSGDPAMIKAYLDRYPNGTFADLARLKLKGLGKQRNAALAASISRTRFLLQEEKITAKAAEANALNLHQTDERMSALSKQRVVSQQAADNAKSDAVQAAAEAERSRIKVGRLEAELAYGQSMEDSGSSAMIDAYLNQRQTAAIVAPPQLVFDVEVLDESLTALKTANVRSQPTTRADKVGSLPANSEVAVTGQTKVSGATWYRVALADGALGYVFGNLLGESEEAPPILDCGPRHATCLECSRDDAPCLECGRYDTICRDAVRGDANAQAALGDRKWLGNSDDAAEAVYWLRKSAEQGNAFGQLYLGRMYDRGRGGLSKNRTAAVQWYRKAMAHENNSSSIEAEIRLEQLGCSSPSKPNYC